jgi:RimJ/RimL family protein N-acetyltransferase
MNLFTGTLVKLSAIRNDDLEVMAKWEEDSEYLRNVDTELAYPKHKDQLENETGGNQVYFRLRTIQEDRLIGFVTIHTIEWNNRTGTLAIGIGSAADRNNGYGSEALRLILRYAFHECNLDRVGLEVIESNEGAIRVYEKAGFQHEGRKRQAVYRDGRRVDVAVMGILRHEWESLQSSNVHPNTSS